MSRSMLFISMAMLGLLAGLARADDPAVNVTQVVETRIRQVIKAPAPPWEIPELTVQLRISGAPVKSASLAEPPAITEARDDTGADLIQPKDDVVRDDSGPFPMGMGEHDVPMDAVNVPLRLKVPSRKARTIASLKGQVTLLAGGQEKTLNATDLAKLADKEIENADLKAAGVSVRVLASKDDKTLALRISGATQAIKSTDVLDGAGESLIHGSMISGDEKGNTDATYDLTKPLDVKTTLRMTVMVGQKKLVVPFVLKDIALP